LRGQVSRATTGGQCGPSALSAAFSKAATAVTASYLDSKNLGDVTIGVAIHAVVGGTAAELGGGKFANGAQTGAFSYLFNEALHSRDTVVTIYGRYAAGVGDAVCRPDCLHLSIVIRDQYDGVTLIDGQPRFSVNDSTVPATFDLTLGANVALEFQKNSVFHVDLVTPVGMSGRQFASALLAGARNFADGSVNYTIPLLPSGNMHGGYNSNSFASGLLRSVTGSVPAIKLPSTMQAPGWGSPLAGCHFRNPGC
jgi:hypothetical protein